MGRQTTGYTHIGLGSKRERMPLDRSDTPFRRQEYLVQSVIPSQQRLHASKAALRDLGWFSLHSIASYHTTHIIPGDKLPQRFWPLYKVGQRKRADMDSVVWCCCLLGDRGAGARWWQDSYVAKMPTDTIQHCCWSVCTVPTSPPPCLSPLGKHWRCLQPEIRWVVRSNDDNCY